MKLGYFKRRDFLRHAGAASMFLPFMQMFGSRAVAQANTVIPRVVYWYTPLGHLPIGLQRGKTYPDATWPTGPDDAPVFKPSMSRLNEIKGDLTMLKGVGLKNGGGGGAHNRGFVQLLTGAAPTSGTHESVATARSIDDVLVADLRLTRMYVAVQAQAGKMQYDNISYRGQGQPNSFHRSPQASFASLFNGFTPPGGMPAAPVANDDQRKQATGQMMSALRADAAKIKGIFSGDADIRQQFDGYIDSINRLEQATNDSATRPVGVGCALPTQMAANSFPTTGTAFMHQMQMALACNRAQIGIFQWNGAGTQNGFSLPWLSYGGSPIGFHHDISHIRGSNPIEKQAVIYDWYHQQLVTFVKLLKNVPDGAGGTLLDSTMILTLSDVSDGSSHGFNNIPMFVAGGKKLGIKHGTNGRVLNLPNMAHNRLLVTTAKVLGHTMTSFGANGGGGPVTQLFT
jgi:hypothetical protein